MQIGHHRIPDRDIAARAFVAVPLAELDPGYVHPDLNETLETIAQRLTSQSPSMQLRSDVVLPIG
jgi:7,8-dihydro-6-hydroxymethylpterin-pyrophosphokinase